MMASQTDTPAILAPRQCAREGMIAFRARIGVTGHRRIANREDVALAVAVRLSEIREIYPPTRFTPVVFSVLSALAEGADRLVVNVALGADPDFEVELGAVLPLGVEDYLGDFETDTSRREFHDLLSRSTARVELQRGQSLERLERDEAYDRAGRYIVDHSDVLIAVWDGRESQGQGGTAETVEYARQRGVPVFVVPASNGGGGDTPSLEDVDFSHESRPRNAAREAFRRIDRYNRVSLRSTWARDRIGAERARLGRPLECSSMHWRYMLVADWALPHLVRADRLAVLNQQYHRILAWAIHLLAALAVTDVAIETLFFDKEPAWLVGEIFLVVMLLLAVVTGRRVRFNDRWIGYRSLAEGFRSALFFALSGGDDRRGVASAGVLGEPEEAWFQRAFSQAWRSCPEFELERGDAAPLRNFLVGAWIDHQIRYHRHTANRWKHLHSLCTWTMSIFALATIVVAMLHIAKVGNGSWVEDALKLSALTLPAFGGAVAGLREYGQLRLHEERSKRAVNRLRGLKGRLAVSSTLASVRRLAGDTQRVMVDETVDWYGVVEFQDVDIVI
jgi:hypothetical protein